MTFTEVMKSKLDETAPLMLYWCIYLTKAKSSLLSQLHILWLMSHSLETDKLELKAKMKIIRYWCCSQAWKWNKQISLMKINTYFLPIKNRDNLWIIIYDVKDFHRALSYHIKENCDVTVMKYCIRLYNCISNAFE